MPTSVPVSVLLSEKKTLRQVEDFKVLRMGHLFVWTLDLDELVEVCSCTNPFLGRETFARIYL